MGFRPDVRYSFAISALGLSSGLKLCVDAGDINSYASGQKWLDTSGGGYDFVLGTTTGAESSDPAFTGTPGGLSVNEYWACDTDALFTYDSANESWMNNLHKDGAKFTALAWIYYTNVGAGSSACVFGTLGNTLSTSGIQLQINAGTGVLRLQVGNGSGVAALNAVSSGSAVGLSGWHLVGLSLDENAGASGGQFYVDGAVNGSAFDPAYSSPSAAAASFAMQVAADGNGQRPLGLNGAARIAFIAIWEGTTLSASQIAQIYNYQPTISAIAGSYAVSGVATPLSTSMAAAATSYAGTGIAATFKPAIVGTVGSYSIAGQAALAGVLYSVSAGAYSVAAQVAGFATKLACGVGSFSLASVGAPFAAALTSSFGSYTVTGQDATLSRDFVNWVQRPFDSDNWSDATVQAETWTVSGSASSSWTAATKQSETWTPATAPSSTWTTE